MTSVRFDRLATLYVAQPLLRTGGRRKEAYLPVLMYHSISDTPETAVRAYYRTVTAPNVFEAQMDALRKACWRGVTLREGLETLAASPAKVEKMVAITFD